VEGPSLLGGGGPDALADGPGAEEAGVVERRVPGARLVGGPHGLGMVEAIAVAHNDDPLHSVPGEGEGGGGWRRRMGSGSGAVGGHARAAATQERADDATHPQQLLNSSVDFCLPRNPFPFFFNYPFRLQFTLIILSQVNFFKFD